MRHGLLLLALGCTPPEESPRDLAILTDSGEPAPEGPRVLINEVMPGNQSTLVREGGMPDWIELVNLDEAPVPLSELTLRNGDGERWTGSEADGAIAPGERRLLLAGEGSGGDEPWTGFTLDKDGDKLTLLNSGDRVLDYLDLEAVDSDVSWARTPDKTGEFAPTARPTPGAENGEAPSPTLNPADETLFRTDRVHEIAFTFTRRAYQQIDQADRPEVHVAADIDGIGYPDVGLSLKGSASYDTMQGKPAFVVDFNRWVPGTRFRGLKAIKLHNGNVLDPTRTRDHLSYRLARESGLMAPRVGWAHVTCDGEDYGIYMIIEKHDEEMIAYHHPDQVETGMLMEPNESRGGQPIYADFGQGVQRWDYETGPVPPDPAAVAALEGIDRLVGLQPSDERIEELWTYVDKDPFLTYLAWETLVMHFDGYQSPNNWRIYVDGETHLVRWVPSGAEWTWDWLSQAFFSYGSVAVFCFRNEGCSRDYAERVVQMADRVEALDLLGEFEALSSFLDPWIQSDPRYDAWQSVEDARSSTQRRLSGNPGSARRQALGRFPELGP